MADNDAPEAGETAAKDAQAAAGGSDAPIEEAGVEPAGAAGEAAAAAGETGTSIRSDGAPTAGSGGGDDIGGGIAVGDTELDIDAAHTRLEEVGDEIEKGKQALADMEDEVNPKPDGPPIAEGEGAANAPPG